MNKKIVKLPKQNNPSAVQCFLISYRYIHSSVFVSHKESGAGHRAENDQKQQIFHIFLRPSSDTEQLK